MKNNIPRRTFIKQSVAGVAIAANVGLVAGLASLPESSGHEVSVDYTFSQTSTGYSSASLAQSAGDQIIADNQDITKGNWTKKSSYGHANGGCQPYTPDHQVPDPVEWRVIVTQDLNTGLWRANVNANVSLIHCHLP